MVLVFPDSSRFLRTFGNDYSQLNEGMIFYRGNVLKLNKYQSNSHFKKVHIEERYATTLKPLKEANNFGVDVNSDSSYGRFNVFPKCPRDLYYRHSATTYGTYVHNMIFVTKDSLDQEINLEPFISKLISLDTGQEEGTLPQALQAARVLNTLGTKITWRDLVENYQRRNLEMSSTASKVKAFINLMKFAYNW